MSSEAGDEVSDLALIENIDTLDYDLPSGEL